MKKYCLLITMFMFTGCNLFGEIKNGYENEILSMKECLKDLTALDDNNNLCASQRRKIENKIKSLVNNISFYELTEKLLEQFRIISPALYNEIDTIKDKKGRAVNVYVKVVPTDATMVKAWGTTYISQSSNDPDRYCSEYGEFTVSVKIWMVNNALLVLSHELGHVKYQVPNLACYLEYYKKHYYNIMNQSNYIGHNAYDLSGKSAKKYEKIFRNEFASFLRMTNEKILSPVVLMEKIKKNFSNDRIYSKK